MTAELTEQIHQAWRESFQVLNRDLPGIRGLLDVSKVSPQPGHSMLLDAMSSR